MNEYKVTFHKYPHFLTSEEHRGFMKALKKGGKEEAANRDLRTLGTFDRMTLEVVDAFSESRDFSSYANKWNGDSLSLLLYDIEDRDRSETDEGDSLFKMGMEVDKNSESRLCYFPFEKGRFVALTFFSLSDLLMVGEGSDYGTFLCRLKEKIEGYIQSEGMSYRLLGSFGLSDFCILWLAQDYKTVLKAVEKLKGLIFRARENETTALFSGFYTVFSLNRQPSEKETLECWKEELKDFREQISVCLSTRQESSRDKFLKELADYFKGEEEKITVHSAAGECDLMLMLPAALLLPQLLPGGFLHYGSDFYQTYLSASQIRLLSEPSALPPMKEAEEAENAEGSEKPWEFSNIQFCVLDPKLIFDKERGLRKKIEGKNGLREKAKNAFFSLSCFVDDFDAFYHDLRDYLFSQAKLQRRLDCAERFDTILKIMENKLDRINDEDWSTEETFLDYRGNDIDGIRLLMTELRTQLGQERELGLLALDAPLCQGNFNGHQDLILHSYNNYLKEILRLIYPLRGAEQQRICPMVTSSTVFQVRSTQFSGYDGDKSISLVNYELPTAVMTDLPFGMASTLHETFHYVQPASREERNILSAVPFLCELTLSCFCSRLAEYMEDRAGVEQHIRLERNLISMIFSICKNSKEYTAYMQKMLELVDNYYDALFSERNPGQFFGTFCDILMDMVTGIRSCTGVFEKDDSGLFFEQCLRTLESTLCGLICSYTYTVEGVEYESKPTDAEAIREEICRQLLSEDAYYIQYWVEYYRKVLLDPYREIKADVGMLSVTGMTETDYRLFYVTLHSLLVGEPERLTPEEDDLRLYCVHEYLHLRENQTPEQDEFGQRYVARFIGKSSKEKKNGKQTVTRVKKLIKTAKSFQRNIEERLEAAEIDYAVYRPLFRAILERFEPYSGIKDQNKPEIMALSAKFMEDIREAETSVGKKLMGLYEAVSLSTEEWGTLCRNHQKQIFTLDMNFIHRIQNTCLLSSLDAGNKTEREMK